jgi:hypothetical protein
MVPSMLPVASVCPSGLNATEKTISVCPNRVAVGCPVAGSHSRTVRSVPALARVRPSGLKATETT